MKITEPIIGFVKYNDKDFSFVCEERFLKLIPTSIEDWKQSKIKSALSWGEKKFKKEWIDQIYIYGKTNKGEDIVFL